MIDWYLFHCCQKIVHTFEALLQFLFLEQKRKLFSFKSAPHRLANTAYLPILQNPNPKAFLITLLLIDLALDNCLFAAVKKLFFFKVLRVSRNNPMLIFDDYLHQLRDIISRIAFPCVCPFKSLSSPVRNRDSR